MIYHFNLVRENLLGFVFFLIVGKKLSYMVGSTVFLLSFSLLYQLFTILSFQFVFIVNSHPILLFVTETES